MTGRLAAKLLLAGLSLVLTVAAVEIALRIADLDYSPMQVEDRRDDRTHHLFESDAFVFDPVLIWRPRLNTGVFNAQGFRGAELTPEKPAGSIRIATIGDSNTLGWQGATGAHWPGDLEQLLRADDDRHRVINAGVWGYTSHQGTARLREVLPLRPDIVTISFGSNDAHPVAVPDNEYASGAAPRSGQSVLGRTRLGRIVGGAIARIGAEPAASGEATHRVVLTDYRQNLRQMIAMTREAGAQPILLTRPYQDSLPQPPGWKALAPEYNLATLEIAIAEQVPVVDFYSLFKGRDSLFADESHFTVEGHRIAAALLYERLRPFLAAATAG